MSIQQCEDQQMVQQLKPTRDREREAFIEWIRSVTLDLDHKLWRHFQQQISSLMFQFLDKNDKVKTQEPAAAAAAASHGCQPFHPTSLGMWQPSTSQRPAQPTSQPGVSMAFLGPTVGGPAVPSSAAIHQHPTVGPTPSLGPGSSFHAPGRACRSVLLPVMMKSQDSQDSSHLSQLLRGTPDHGDHHQQQHSLDQEQSGRQQDTRGDDEFSYFQVMIHIVSELLEF